MFYPSIIFSEPGSPDLLCFTPHRFLANPAHLIYYVSPRIICSEPGSSDLLRFTRQSFLARSVRLIRCDLPLSRFKQVGPSDLLRLSPPKSGRWLKLGGGPGLGRLLGWLKTVTVFSPPPPQITPHPYLLCFTIQSWRWLNLGGDGGVGNSGETRNGDRF